MIASFAPLNTEKEDSEEHEPFHTICINMGKYVKVWLVSSSKAKPGVFDIATEP